jgi:signal transduction histidine kinase
MQSKWSHLERLALTGELAAMVAHEIKNPLAALRGWAETLSELAPKLTDADRPRLEKALGIIKDESDRIDARVQSLLQVARPPVATPAAPFQVHQVVSEAVALVEAQSRTVQVSLQLAASGSSVRGSADGLRTALVNLLRNAIEAQGSGEVMVQVTSRPGAVNGVVVDQGSGLSADQLAQPIVAFRSTKPGGSGLGLVIAEAGVRACSGTLSFAANTPRGTCATITLPVEP